MKTTIHQYHFDTRKQEKEYKEFCAQLKALGLRKFCSWGGNPHYDPANDNRIIELEPAYLFKNQWNTQIGRVFDWAEDYPVNFSKYIKKGHYLVQTDEMKNIRNNTLQCGYCGKQYPFGSTCFCMSCLGSEFLTLQDLPLLRLLPISEDKNRSSLSKDEEQYLVPLYTAAQAEILAIRLAKRKSELLKDHSLQQKKLDGMLWLLDHGVDIDNIIYYPHRDIFCFGWQKPYEKPVPQGFPFQFEVKR